MASEPVGIQRAKVEVLDGVRHDLNWRSKQINGLPAKVVTRGTRWGNPFVAGTASLITDGLVTKDNCLILYRIYCYRQIQLYPDWLEPLRGHNLACFCKIGAVCHRDTLLKLLKGLYPDDDK